MSIYKELSLCEIRDVKHITAESYLLVRGVMASPVIIKRLMKGMPKELLNDLVYWGVDNNPAVLDLCEYISCSPY